MCVKEESLLSVFYIRAGKKSFGDILNFVVLIMNDEPFFCRGFVDQNLLRSLSIKLVYLCFKEEPFFPKRERG
ncbi:MAG TPA: hypothetical protein DHV52_01225 [Parachlamydiales bacterium]|nr:hypothetical protein [Parachlamydiales bacterium]